MKTFKWKVFALEFSFKDKEVFDNIRKYSYDHLTHKLWVVLVPRHSA